MHVIVGRLIVNFVLGLICFIAYSSQIFIVWPWYGRALSVELLTLIVPFNTLVGLLLLNYFLCVVTDPGQAPAHWKPDTHSDGYEVKKLTGVPRYCRVCEKYKPPRAHHCRQCNRCVLRMDHHCPWVNNCIGHFNYGHFIRFLFYVDLACSYHLAMITRRVFDTMGHQFWDEPSSLELIFIILNYTACIPVLLAVGAFSIYHFYSLLGNSTTIEGWEKDKVATMVRRGQIQEVKFPYDLGIRRNIESVLGRNPLLWCCPTVTPGSGLKYELAESDVIHALWPPQNPAHLSDAPDHALALPNSPWTYENDSLNPNLEPSNARLRRAASMGKQHKRQVIDQEFGKSSLPPYHPDFNDANVTNTLEGGDSTSEDSEDTTPFIRAGSEGYEVQSVDREDVLRRYVMELGQEPGRYHRYISSPDSDSDEEHLLQDS